MQKEVKIPDIGDYANVEIIEIHVAKGQPVDAEATLITLETDKATIDIPSPNTGKIADLHVKVGDKVSKDSLVITLSLAEDNNNIEASPSEEPPKTTSNYNTDSAIIIPDLGTTEPVTVIEVNVSKDQEVAIDDTLITLESDKASMEVPAPIAGIISEIKVKVGDKVSQGNNIGTITGCITTEVKPEPISESIPLEDTQINTVKEDNTVNENNTADVYAGPGVRRFARKLGVDLTKVTGTGKKSRITKVDVEQYVKGSLQSMQSSKGMNIPELPIIDFAKFGEVTTQQLSRINKISGSTLHRNWLTVPHVTQFDEADITDLESFRKEQKLVADKAGIKLSPLAFILKATAQTLKAFPIINASISSDGAELILKKYFHIGVAVDTPNGLVVPVLRNVDQKSIYDLAKELTELTIKAREGKLSAQNMQGGCFTISSLGGLGGTAFTPIVNLPEVAILGISKSQYKPVYKNGEFIPRLMLPLSFSYDHRVINGAEAAKFTSYLREQLTDIRRILL